MTQPDDRLDDSNADPMDELGWKLEDALREALTKGVSMENMQLLCYSAGIPMERVTG